MGRLRPKSLEKFLEERKKEFIPMFGGILKSCLEESTGEGFNKKTKIQTNILISFSVFLNILIASRLWKYNISSPLTLLKNHLKTVYKNTSQANMFLMLYLIMVYNNIRLESSL